jgi:hypothetical protein
MRRPIFNDTRRQPAPAGAREVLAGKESDERDRLKENPHRIPIPMLLIIGALMGASD